MRSIEQRVINDLTNRIKGDEELQELFKKDPEKGLKKAGEEISKQHPLRYDKWIYRMVVFSLGVTLFCSVIGAIWIILSGGDTIPEILIAIGSASVGALAGLLAPSPKGKEEG